MIFSSLSQLPGFKRQGQRLNLDPGQVFAVDVARITGKEKSNNGDNRPTVNHWLRKVAETGGGEEVVMELSYPWRVFGIWSMQVKKCAEQW